MTLQDKIVIPEYLINFIKNNLKNTFYYSLIETNLDTQISLDCFTLLNSMYLMFNNKLEEKIDMYMCNTEYAKILKLHILRDKINLNTYNDLDLLPFMTINKDNYEIYLKNNISDRNNNNALMWACDKHNNLISVILDIIKDYSDERLKNIFQQQSIDKQMNVFMYVSYKFSYGRQKTFNELFKFIKYVNFNQVDINNKSTLMTIYSNSELKLESITDYIVENYNLYDINLISNNKSVLTYAYLLCSGCYNRTKYHFTKLFDTYKNKINNIHANILLKNNCYLNYVNHLTKILQICDLDCIFNFTKGNKTFMEWLHYNGNTKYINLIYHKAQKENIKFKLPCDLTLLSILSYDENPSAFIQELNNTADYSILSKLDRNHNSTLLHACIGKNEKIILELLKYKSYYDINLANINKHPPLHYAIMYCNINVINNLISNNCNLQYITKDGNTPLLIAVLHNKPDIVEILCSHNINISHINKKGYTALTYACKNQYYDIVNILLKKPYSCGLDIPYKNHDYEAIHINTTPIKLINNYNIKLKMLSYPELCNLSHNCERSDEYSKTILFQTICEYAQTKNPLALNVITKLLETPELCNMANVSNKVTPLLFALSKELNNIAKLLLKTPKLCCLNYIYYDCDYHNECFENYKNICNDENALMVACKMNNNYVITIILDYYTENYPGCNINNINCNGYTPLSFLLYNEDYDNTIKLLDIMIYISDYENINAKVYDDYDDENGIVTPYEKACKLDYNDIIYKIKKLIDAKIES